jgi:ribosomal protein S27E
MSKTLHRTPTGFKEIPCSKCGTHTVKVDSESTSATCFRCVAKGTNPESIILTDLSQEEYTKFTQKLFTNGRPKNTTTESAV